MVKGLFLEHKDVWRSLASVFFTIWTDGDSADKGLHI